MAPNSKLYDSIEEETQVLIVNKNDDDGKSNHQSRFRPSMILGVLAIVALYFMVLATNRVSELNAVVDRVEAELARVHSKFDALSDTVHQTSITASLMSSTSVAEQDKGGHDDQCYSNSDCRSDVCTAKPYAFCVGDVKTSAPTPPPTTARPTSKPIEAGAYGSYCYDTSSCNKGLFCHRNFCDNRVGDGEFCTQDYWCVNEKCSNYKCLGRSDPYRCAQKSDGSDYRGTLTVTEGGKNCQSWSVQWPHKHGNTPQKVPNAGLERNYCRNPDGESRAWCYTQDSGTRWQYCNVPRCPV